MAGRIDIVGLGPGDLDRVPADDRALLLDPARRVVVRTLRHPAAEALAGLRPILSGDRFYEELDDFDAVYAALADLVVSAAAAGDDVVFAVPGSPFVGERTVPLVVEGAAADGIDVEIHPAESFLDLVLAVAGIDPIDDGVQVLDGRAMPDPLPLHVPTVVTQVDVPVVLADVQGRLSGLLDDDRPVLVLRGLGSADAEVIETTVGALDPDLAGLRTTLVLDPAEVGLLGAVHTMRVLRRRCPWDSKQTHHSLVKNLVEECFELVEALAALPEEAPAGEPDWGAYAEVEEELGDVLLQVLFHCTMAAEAGAFDIDDVAEQLRRKLVRRHPHVFGDVEASTADEVLANWERIKQEEKRRTSLMDDIPSGLPALERAAKVQRRAASVGFDWPSPREVLEKVREEVDELEAVLDDPAEASRELGDLLFSIVNLARHLHADPEVSLRRAADRFMERFRAMEAHGDLEGRPLAELDALWEEAKARAEAPETIDEDAWHGASELIDSDPEEGP